MAAAPGRRWGLPTCARPTLVAPPPEVDGGIEGPLDGCLYETCPDEAEVCAADPDCVAFEACFRACRGTAGCVADCSAGLPQASVGRHRAMYMCANPAGCYR